MIDQEIIKLRANLSKTAKIEVELERLSGKNLTWEQLTGLTLGGGLFSSLRLVVIEQFDACDLEDREADFERLISQLPESTHLVLVQPKAFTATNKIGQVVKKHAQMREFQPFTKWQEAEVAGWITRYVESKGKTIAPDALELLPEIAGNDLRSLSSELEKIITYAGDKKQLSLEDVEAVASLGEVDIFNFTEALKDKNAPAAFGFLERLLKNKEDPVKIIGLLASQFRFLAKLKSLAETTKDQSDLINKMGARPYAIKKGMQQLSRFSKDELAKILELLHVSDLKMKTGKVPQLNLELLAGEICRK